MTAIKTKMFNTWLEIFLKLFIYETFFNTYFVGFLICMVIPLVYIKIKNIKTAFKVKLLGFGCYIFVLIFFSLSVSGNALLHTLAFNEATENGCLIEEPQSEKVIFRLNTDCKFQNQFVVSGVELPLSESQPIQDYLKNKTASK